MTAGKRQGVTRQQFLAFAYVSRWRNQARDRVEDRRLAARARYPAPAVGLPPHIGLLPLSYIAGSDARPVCCNQRTMKKWPLSRVFVGFNRQYVRSGHYGEVWEFFLVLIGVLPKNTTSRVNHALPGGLSLTPSTRSDCKLGWLAGPDPIMCVARIMTDYGTAIVGKISSFRCP